MMKLALAALLSVALGATVRPGWVEPTTAPKPTPVVASPSPAPKAKKDCDTAIILPDGTVACAKGDNAVTVGANEDAGAAAVKGDENAVAAAAPGGALGVANLQISGSPSL